MSPAAADPALRHVKNRVLKALEIVQPPFAASWRPPVRADLPRLRGLVAGLFLQSPRRPGLELIHDLLGVATGGGHDDVNMVRAAGDCVQVPAVNSAMIQNRAFDDRTLSLVQHQWHLCHAGPGSSLEVEIGRTELAWLRNPASCVASKPGPILGPSEEVGQRLALGERIRTKRHRGTSGWDLEGY
jgi:hypothetical protein